MTFLPSFVRAEPRGDFRLRVVFNDGSENTINFTLGVSTALCLSR